MTYQESQNDLAALQASITTAQNTVTNTQQTLDYLQSLLPGAQSAVNAFHRYVADWTPDGSTQRSNLQLPPDAESNGYQVTVIRDTPPEPIPCDQSTYDTGSLTWSEPTPSTVGWSDLGAP